MILQKSLHYSESEKLKIKQVPPLSPQFIKNLSYLTPSILAKMWGKL